MATYLKIENPGVCPTEGFILLGATSKRLADNDSPFTIGQFGSGNKHAVNVLLRAKLYPVIFCGNHRLEYGTKPGKMKALEGEAAYNRVIVKHGGTDEAGASCHVHRGTFPDGSVRRVGLDLHRHGLP